MTHCCQKFFEGSNICSQWGSHPLANVFRLNYVDFIVLRMRFSNLFFYVWCFQYPFFFHLIRLAIVNQSFSYGFWHETIVWKRITIILCPYWPASDFWHWLFNICQKEKRTGAGKRGKNRKREEQIHVLNIWSLSIRNIPIKRNAIQTMKLLGLPRWCYWLRIHLSG